jgi:hypothetical protein
MGGLADVKLNTAATSTSGISVSKVIGATHLDPFGDTDLDLFIDATGRRIPRHNVALRHVLDFAASNSEFGSQLMELIYSNSFGLLER